MRKRVLDKARLGEFEDWFGNNAAVRCPACFKIFIVSGFINKGIRPCPRCGRSNASITTVEASVDWAESGSPVVLTRAELENTGRLDDFVALVELGGAVSSQSIQNRLPKVEKAAVIEHRGRIVACAAKKSASRPNAEQLHARSGFALPIDSPELGYVVVEPDHLGQHLSTKVLRRILLEFGDVPAFATTSDSKIKHLLTRSEFEWVGHEWDSQLRPGEKLSLWVRGMH